MKVSTYKNTYSGRLKDMTMKTLVDNISGGFWFKRIFDLKKIRAKSIAKYDEAKRELPCFTPCGVFSDCVGRNKKKKNYGKPCTPYADSILQYNRIIIVDFDKLNDFQMFEVWDKIRNCPYTFVAFKSPSGVGIKVFVKVGTTKKDHLKAFNAVNEHYANLCGIKFDKSGSNINRLCYVSNDPEAIYREDAKVFEFQTSLFEPSKKVDAQSRREGGV